MSIDMTEVILFFLVFIELFKSNNAYSVDILFIKPYCEVFINECLEIKLLSMFFNSFPVILENCETIDMGLKLEGSS